MPAEVNSPARRPQLKDRSSSAVSLPRGSPSALQSTSHKGSSTRLHRAHIVGGNKIGHGRVPSTGKGLHKLSKVTGQRHEDFRAHKKAQSPSTSPTATQVKRNSSNFSLAKAGSKVNIRKNKSDVSIKRHSSGQKGPKGPKSERGHVQFDVGDEEPDMEGKFGEEGSAQEDQEEEWTEASNSQSPAITRRGSVAPLRPSNLEEPPSPDDPPARSPPAVMPDSPPKSPSQQSEESGNVKEQPLRSQSAEPSRQSDKQSAERLMNQRDQPVTSHLSSISAIIAPSTQNGRVEQQSEGVDLQSPSMPSNGISQYTSPRSHHSGGSVSSDSGSQLHCEISGVTLKEKDDPSDNVLRDTTGSSPDPRTDAVDARKAQAAVDIYRHQSMPSSSSQQSTSPDRHHDGHLSRITRSTPRSSPFDAHHASKGAGIGRSLTQLKLDLERMRPTRGADSEQNTAQQSPSPTSLPNGAAPDEMQRLHHRRMERWASAGKMDERRRKMYESVAREYGNMRRFQDVSVKAIRRLEKQGKVNLTPVLAQKERSIRKKKVSSMPASQHQGDSNGSFERTESTLRGRVRFDTGKAVKEADGHASEEEEGEVQADGVQGILRRMWRDFEAAQE